MSEQISSTPKHIVREFSSIKCLHNLARLSEAEIHKQIVECAEDAIVCIDARNRITLFNASAETMFGYRADEVIGHPLDLLLPEDAIGRHADHVHRFAQSGLRNAKMGERGYISGRRRSGEVFPAQATISVVKLGGEDIFTAIIRDITEARNQELEIIAARMRAEKSDRAKSEFLAQMSHEFRTPLNAIIGFSEALLAGVVGPTYSDRYREYVRDIRTSGLNLLEIVSGMIELARAEMGQEVAAEADLPLAEIVAAAVKEAAALAGVARISIATDLRDAPPCLRGDRRLLFQMLSILVSHAVRASPAGSEVTVRALPAEADKVWLCVEDQGAGMTGEEVLNALNPFGDGAADIARHRHGSGLGLSIVNRLAALSGVHFEISRLPGGGTRTALRLPGAGRSPRQSLTAHAF